MDPILADIIQWDVHSWARALRFWGQRINWDRVEQGLELGGRQGGLSLWMALHGKRAVCSDLQGTQATAAPLHAKHRVGHLITYRDIDATDIPYEDHFDLIAFKSIIGGIGRDGHPERQRAVFAQIHKALKPGGMLVFAENLTASPLHRAMRKRFVRWGDSWRYLTLDETADFLKPFKAHELRATGVLAAFGRSEGQRRALARMDQAVMDHLVPDRWKYIVYGAAVK